MVILESDARILKWEILRPPNSENDHRARLELKLILENEKIEPEFLECQNFDIKIIIKKRRMTMFKVKDYKITFERKKVTFETGGTHKIGNTICKLFMATDDIPYEGNAKLHPNDQYDKIVGKKIALTKALATTGLQKPERTEIWKEFWEWIDSWKTQAAMAGMEKMGFKKELPDKKPQNAV